MTFSTKRSSTLYWFLIAWLITIMLWWGFAFMPLPVQSEAWINQAREVCFGTMSNGLPAPYGWLLLIGAPLMVLSAILVLWGHETNLVWDRLKHQLFHQILFSILVLTFLTELVLAGQKIRTALLIPTNPADFEGNIQSLDNLTRLNQPASDFTLIDQQGKNISLSDKKGQVVYLTFAYAHCQTMCPTLIHDVRQAVTDLGDKKASAIFVTLDPWRDTPSSLPKLFREWDLSQSSHVVSGQPDQVSAVLDAYNVPRGRSETNGDISHPALVYLIDPQGRIAYVFNHASANLLTQAGKQILD